MKKILLVIASLFLLGCNQYSDNKLLCHGDIEKEVNNQKSILKNQYIIFKVKDDDIRIGKSKEFIKEWVNSCKQGSHPSATKDQIYFNINTCEDKREPSSLTFEGTYNLATKKLNVKQLDDEVSLNGNFTCSNANLSQ